MNTAHLSSTKNTSPLAAFADQQIDWNLTPEMAVTLYLEWGNNDWRSEHPPVRSKSDVATYFVVDAWQVANYDSMLVLSHFKGHPMGGFGGALKQLSIGCASSYGKAYIHGAGEPEKIWTADHNSFLDAMADAASSVAEYFKDKTVFINVMKNMSVDCDCCAVAEDPCMADIGILASLDPIAVDQACLDLVYASDDPGRDHLVERIESLNGVRTVESAAALGFGTREYELVEL